MKRGARILKKEKQVFVAEGKGGYRRTGRKVTMKREESRVDETDK